MRTQSFLSTPQSLAEVVGDFTPFWPGSHRKRMLPGSLKSQANLVTDRASNTKVSIDTFVQWIHFYACGVLRTCNESESIDTESF
jgi:hypothetical protein